MKNIVKKENAVRRQFLGVDFVVLSMGRDTMVTKMLYKQTDFVPFHKHPNEQSGYVISGKYKLAVDGKEHDLKEGDTYSIPADIEHSIKIIEAGEVVDVFSPIRQDYL
ncbi:cupin domain-containing protein [Flagellimonas lutimaris]|uniref:Cupin domain-containing protein n=1 Tax=Flagellimonas lutimaris TaxID=475082 RepID=A0A3A1N4K4_9FLAO|nr:cupin domain-containing protein [Allomuricauda lutimaris]RIV31668.1 cupin domain-containing protein [Allomuricauda lutimaris]